MLTRALDSAAVICSMEKESLIFEFTELLRDFHAPWVSM